ncbi:hypothetical protein MY11210_005744 [Beauveria gryllotalpidicola]
MRTFTRRLPGAVPLPRASIAPCAKTLSRPLAASRPRTTTMTMRCQQQLFAARSLHTTPLLSKQKKAQEHTPTNFQDLDVLGNTPVPSTSVDVCMYDGFGLNSGITITDGDGALLADGEAFTWRPWEISGEMRLLNDKGEFDVPAEALGVFDMLWPRPGMRLEVLDTRNAASQFNLLATERGVADVAAVLIPIGWQEGIGAAE